MGLLVLGSALDLFLDVDKGAYFLVTVVEEHVIGIRDGVVRGDGAGVSAVAGEELADFGVDKSVACGAEAFVVVVTVVLTTVRPVVLTVVLTTCKTTS
jgi:hypothetical protein